MSPKLERREESTANDGQVAEPGDKNSIPWDDVFDLLSNERRRLALEYVARSRGPADVQDVVDWVFDRQSKDSEETSRKATYVALHQVHFPKLADYDVVVWDQDDGKLYLGEKGGFVADAMERTVGRDADERSFRDRLTDWI